MGFDLGFEFNIRGFLDEFHHPVVWLISLCKENINEVLGVCVFENFMGEVHGSHGSWQVFNAASLGLDHLSIDPNL